MNQAWERHPLEQSLIWSPLTPLDRRNVIASACNASFRYDANPQVTLDDSSDRSSTCTDMSQYEIAAVLSGSRWGPNITSRTHYRIAPGASAVTPNIPDSQACSNQSLGLGKRPEKRDQHDKNFPRRLRHQYYESNEQLDMVKNAAKLAIGEAWLG
ncbi:hypothetical protein PIIN_11507 [Serendipita indica DSM 11827]|uniref:Uncharacterized protein n=1 Tax=Serendipita indica (strain DSM 11827) TaxID=1109443 RepID=G4U1T7_SERID|nr:hypothetical protein PIIN_11507 [Serendipita indica DSM 11827]